MKAGLDRIAGLDEILAIDISDHYLLIAVRHGTMSYRNQQVMIANIYRQDFIKPGYTIQASFHYNKDDPSFEYDTNNFLVRPAPIGTVTSHSIRAYYYGLT